MSSLVRTVPLGRCHWLCLRVFCGVRGRLFRLPLLLVSRRITTLSVALMVSLSISASVSVSVSISLYLSLSICVEGIPSQHCGPCHNTSMHDTHQYSAHRGFHHTLHEDMCVASMLSMGQIRRCVAQAQSLAARRLLCQHLSLHVYSAQKWIIFDRGLFA